MRYEVQVSTHTTQSVWVHTKHRYLAAAIRSARSIIGGRKHRLTTLKTCVIWDSQTNQKYSVALAEELRDLGGAS